MTLDLQRRDAEDEPHPPEIPPPHRGRLRIVVTGLVVGLFGLAAAVLLIPRSLTTSPPDADTAVTTPGSASARRIQATLFYVSEDGTLLVPTTRSVLYGETMAAQARRLVEAQVADAPGGLANAIPKGTTVRAVYISNTREVYVDLGGTFSKLNNVGTIDEALAVYAIVNTVTVNLPDVIGVQILVDGKEVDSAAGHIDLRAPLAKDLTWLEKGQ
jgi:hypothetical protein